MKELKKRHQFLEKKGFITVQEELKQRIRAKADTIRRYNKRCNRFKENRLFDNNQRMFYRNMGEDVKDKKKEGIEEKPDKDACTKFWSDIWSNAVEHNEQAEWVKDIDHQLEHIAPQEELVIDLPKLKERLRRMSNWTAAGPDGVHGY